MLDYILNGIKNATDLRPPKFLGRKVTAFPRPTHTKYWSNTDLSMSTLLVTCSTENCNFHGVHVQLGIVKAFRRSTLLKL